MGVQSCYCGPVLHRLECRLAKDKQDILQRLDSAHLRLDARIDGLERKTQQQLQGLQRTVDSLGLESSAAGLQRVRNSIVLADPGHTTPPLPSLDFMSNSSAASSQRSADRHLTSRTINNNNNNYQKTGAPAQQPNEVQYTLDKLGLDVTEDNKQIGLQALRNRLALTRIREQRELDAIVEHYERRGHHRAEDDEATAQPNERGEEDESEESEAEDDEVSPDIVLPPPVLSSQNSPMLSDSRYAAKAIHCSWRRAHWPFHLTMAGTRTTIIRQPSTSSSFCRRVSGTRLFRHLTALATGTCLYRDITWIPCWRTARVRITRVRCRREWAWSLIQLWATPNRCSRRNSPSRLIKMNGIAIMIRDIARDLERAHRGRLHPYLVNRFNQLFINSLFLW